MAKTVAEYSKDAVEDKKNSLKINLVKMRLKKLSKNKKQR